MFAAFGDPILLLFVGSFLLARAMQVHGVDRRLAYALLAHPWVGGSTVRTLWALGLVAWLLAMWMSITACVAMLLPVVVAIARVSGRVTAEAMRRMNYAVDAQRQDPAAVVTAFLDALDRGV